MKYFISQKNKNLYVAENGSPDALLETILEVDHPRGLLDIALTLACRENPIGPKFVCNLLVSTEERIGIFDSFEGCRSRALALSYSKFSESLDVIQVKLSHSVRVRSYSVVVPFFNPKIAELERCLRSIDQSLISVGSIQSEIIAVDDGSANSSAVDELLTKLRIDFKTKVQLTRLNQNQGVSVARNQGFTSARGDFVFFIDSDDEVSAEYFSLLGAELEGGSELTVSSMKLLGGKTRYQFASYIDSRSLIRENTMGAGIGIRKNSEAVQTILKSGGLYNPVNRYHFEDWELNLFFSFVNAKISVVPVTAYIYHPSPRGRNASQPERQLRSALDVVIHALDRLEKIKPDLVKGLARVALEEFGNRLVRSEQMHRDNLQTLLSRRNLSERAWGHLAHYLKRVLRLN